MIRGKAQRSGFVAGRKKEGAARSFCGDSLRENEAKRVSSDADELHIAIVGDIEE